eukprot:4365877-Prymnesium_polylepis.1
MAYDALISHHRPRPPGHCTRGWGGAGHGVELCDPECGAHGPRRPDAHRTKPREQGFLHALANDARKHGCTAGRDAQGPLRSGRALPVLQG